MSDFVTKIKVRGEEYDIRDAGAARIDSPEFTGVPLAPTADADTDSPQIATTAFVQRAVKDKFGKPGGIAILDENGKVPTSQLPSYVDDVLEGTYDEANNRFLDTDGNVYTPESDKIYVDINTNTTYRWSGTLYIKIGGGSDEIPDSIVYIDPEEESPDLPDIEDVTAAKFVSYNNADSGLEARNVQEAIDITSSIVKGKNRARVFATTDDMNNWLSDEANKGVASVGDNIYIIDVDVPDWWISAVLTEADAVTGMYYNIAQLETQKVDLTTIESSISSLTNKTTNNENNVNSLFSKWARLDTGVKGTVSFDVNPYCSYQLFCQWAGATMYAIYYIDISNNVVALISTNGNAWEVSISSDQTKLNISNENSTNQWASYSLLTIR